MAKFAFYRKSMVLMGVTLSFMVFPALKSGANEMHDLPKPTSEHQWLQQFVGEWEAKTELIMDPSQPPVQTTGTEKIQSLGGFWTTSEINSTMMNAPFKGLMTLGFDTEKQKYVGTWVDSMTGQLWKYEGTVAPGSNALTMESEGICPMNPGKLMKFREVIELKDNDHKVFTSSILGDDGKWMTVMTSKAHRKH